MKRSPLPKGTQRGWNSTIAPGASPKRKTRVKPRNAKRKGSRFPKQRDKAYTDWIRTLPCTVAGKACWGPIDPAHVNKTRAQGAPDRGEVVPLCRFHHQWQEGQTRYFNHLHGVELAVIATQLECKFALRDFGGTDDAF